MTKKNLWLGILAIALVWGMTVVGCSGGDDGGGGGGGGGKVIIDGWTWGGTYIDRSEGGTSTITMTQGSGNDSNKLTFSGNVQKIPELTWGYAGCYVTPNSANLASLKNADSFSFKCRGDGKQYIVYVDTSDVPENSKFRKTFTASTTDNTITVQYSELVQGYDNTIPFNKNNIKGILFEAFSGITGEGPFNITIWDLKVDGQGGNGGGDGGTFTLTGIPSEYNGKYAFLQAYEEIDDDVEFTVWGFKTITTSETVTLPVISNGSVSIPLWILTSSGNSFTRYSGNHTLESVGVGITNIQSTTAGDFDENGVASIDFSSVAFSNGSATRSWSQGNSNNNNGEGGGGGNSSDFTYTETDTITITKYNGTGGSVTIPAQINGKPVTSIGGNAFGYCTSLTSVTIPNSVTNISQEAFRGCTSLTSVTIPDSVTSIGYDAFLNTAWFNNQPDGLVYAGKVAYKYKGTMPANTSIILRNDTKGIAYNAFYNRTSLTSITIPDNVTSIGGDAFYNCTSLTSVTIPNSVTSIGSYAFYGCSSLTSVTIGNSVTSIGNYAFNSCTGLTSVTIPNSVTSIGNYAFVSCTGLTSVTIPNSVTSIGNYAFNGCRLTSVTIPNSVTSIGDGAFNSCISLTSVTFEGTITAANIGSNAFDGDLRTKYLAGDIGTYTTTAWSSTSVWTKQN